MQSDNKNKLNSDNRFYNNLPTPFMKPKRRDFPVDIVYVSGSGWEERAI